MALVAIALTCGDGTRFTDSSGGCNSFAYTTVGTSANYRGPKFTIMYRLKRHSGTPTIPGARVGMADVNGTARRFWLEVDPDGVNFTIRGKLDTTACGAVTVFSFTKTQDANEHSVAWSYDQAGIYRSYWDGVQQGTGASPCSDISNPAAAGDIFMIAGATNFGGVEIFDIDRVMFTNDLVSSSQIATIDGNCSSF